MKSSAQMYQHVAAEYEALEILVTPCMEAIYQSAYVTWADEREEMRFCSQLLELFISYRYSIKFVVETSYRHDFNEVAYDVPDR